MTQFFLQMLQKKRNYPVASCRFWASFYRRKLRMTTDLTVKKRRRCASCVRQGRCSVLRRRFSPSLIYASRHPERSVAGRKDLLQNQKGYFSFLLLRGWFMVLSDSGRNGKPIFFYELPDFISRNGRIYYKPLIINAKKLSISACSIERFAIFALCNWNANITCTTQKAHIIQRPHNIYKNAV